MTLNLDTLRKIAEAATPGPWESRQNDDMPGKYVVGPRYKFGDVSKGPMTLMQPIFWDQGSADNAEHIATFDPPTVLALLSRLEQAEQAVARVRDMADEMGEGKAFGILTRGREDEYPISYFIEMLEEALDGEPNE